MIVPEITTINETAMIVPETVQDKVISSDERNEGGSSEQSVDMSDENPLKEMESQLNELVRSYGEHHLLVADQLAVIALHHQYATGNLEKSFQTFTRALNIFEFLVNLRSFSAYKSGDYSTKDRDIDYCIVQKGVILTDLGNVLMMMNRHREALTRFEDALQIYRGRGFDESHPRVRSAERVRIRCTCQIETTTTST